jgi:hypothetical protein
MHMSTSTRPVAASIVLESIISPQNTFDNKCCHGQMNFSSNSYRNVEISIPKGRIVFTKPIIQSKPTIQPTLPWPPSQQHTVRHHTQNPEAAHRNNSKHSDQQLIKQPGEELPTHGPASGRAGIKTSQARGRQQHIINGPQLEALPMQLPGRKHMAENSSKALQS